MENDMASTKYNTFETVSVNMYSEQYVQVILARYSQVNHLCGLRSSLRSAASKKASRVGELHHLQGWAQLCSPGTVGAEISGA